MDIKRETIVEFSTVRAMRSVRGTVATRWYVTKEVTPKTTNARSMSVQKTPIVTNIFIPVTPNYIYANQQNVRRIFNAQMTRVAAKGNANKHSQLWLFPSMLL